ncbi:MAG: fasciclin domain-containing protein, partial [Eudoraea sp.]|nr:fasciclin domain-containing protein [Eudoraea sp.]
ITLSLEGESVKLVDAKGNASMVVIADVAASNGVIHAIDSVVMPAD